jgi:chromosome segregation ATPase
MRASLAFLVVAVLAAVQSIGTSQKTVQQKEISGLSARVEELSNSLQNLETTTAGLQTRLAELEQRQAVTKRSRADELNHLKSELASSGCEADQNRAVAMAIASGLPSTTYEGAAAMNCTERLRKIAARIVQTLWDQE